jgi:1-acyl-sn-glycerol-3-phosphate acyltransferase
MTFIRSTLFNVFFFAMTAIMTLGPATYIRYFAPERMLDLARLWARIMLRAVRIICGIRVDVRGLERLADNGPKLIASVHQSAFDTIVWLTLLPSCCYVLKQELLRIPLFGALLPIGGMIAVDRAGGASALRSLLREGERAARDGRQIVIFPEGTRSEPGTVLALQPGVAALAAKTGLPVYPVVTDSGAVWGRRAFHKRPGTIHIRILAPIAAETPRRALMECLRNALRCPAAG